ncbi:MAG: hypothetical protein Q4P06_08085, partial [Actinomycetaceae bacterium]|nr:hypothetical protein [Actinomycetaceae bacterium]
MSWPPLEITINDQTATLYVAGVEQTKVPADKDSALNAAFAIVHQYHRDLPLTIHDAEGTWQLLLTTNGEAIDTTPTPTPSKRHLPKRATIIAATAIIVLAATGTALSYVIHTNYAQPQPEPKPTPIATRPTATINTTP